MKKIILGICLFIFIFVNYKYLFCKYSINYKISNIVVNETYDKGRYIFKVDNKFNYIFYSKKKINKKLITNIKNIDNGKNKCVLPVIKGIESYPMCYENNEVKAYYLVSDVKLVKFLKQNGFVKNSYKNYDEDFYFNKKFKDSIIAIWKYNGYYLINNGNLKTINIFKNDRYDSSLSYLMGNYIISPDYDKNYIFKDFYVFNILNGKYHKVKGNFDISYDSNVLGFYKSFIYYKDNKFKKIYQLNIKKKEIKIVNNFKLDEKLKSDINYFNKNNFYKNVANTKENILINNSEVNMVNEFYDKVYFVEKDKLYLYSPIKGKEFIVKNFEWNFNKENNIFIYNK